MRVLHVIAGARRGGAELFMADAAVALAEGGVAQAAVMRPGPNAARLAKAGVAVLHDPFRKPPWPSARRTVRRAIAAHAPDVIHYWMRRAGAAAPAESRARNLGWFGAYYETGHFKNCAWAVGVTHDVSRWLREERGLAPDRVRTVHTFAEPPGVTQAVPRSAFDIPADAFLILALARLDPVKGLDVAIRAVAGVPAAHLLIAGDGPERGRLERLARDLGVRERVHFLGWREDRHALLKTCDAAVFPSRGDSFGTVMIEAWAVGAPFVATTAPGPRAYVRDGEDGLLSPVDVVDGLKQNLLRLRNEPVLTDTLRRNGRARWAAEFSKDAFLAAQIALYEDIAQCAGKGGIVSARLGSR